MYFVTYEHEGKAVAGVLAKDQLGVIPFGETGPGTLLELIGQGQAGLDLAMELQKKAAQGGVATLPLASVKLLAPIPRPRKNIFCIGKNYRDHAMEFDKTQDASAAVPKNPVIFTKPPTTVIGPEALINPHVGVTQELDYEVELAVVIGRTGTHIAQEDAWDHIFGYTIINDVTARDLQRIHQQWMRGKGLDTFAPMGPYLVHKSAVPHPENLSISLKVNGELRQNSNTSELVFKIPELIATLSKGMTLEAGDIIATGTPAGVGCAFVPPRVLKTGDRLELQIESLGTLRNTVG